MAIAMATATPTTMMTEEELATRATAQRIAFKGKVRSRARKCLDRNKFARSKRNVSARKGRNVAA